MSPTRRDVLKAAIGMAAVAVVSAIPTLAQPVPDSLLRVISVTDDYPRQLGTMVGILLAGYAQWEPSERTHFLTEFERTFPAMSGSIVGIIQRKGDES